jgi:DNA-binding XRE family transcriptional regulator
MLTANQQAVESDATDTPERRPMRTNLIKSRERRGYSQATLAKMIGVHKSSLCRIERGLSNGHLRTWDKLEVVLRVPQRTLRQLDTQRPWAADERNA